MQPEAPCSAFLVIVEQMYKALQIRKEESEDGVSDVRHKGESMTVTVTVNVVITMVMVMLGRRRRRKRR